MEERECLVAAPSRCAVSQVFNLPPVAREQRAADYKSAIRQIKNLRHAKHIPGGTPGELASEDAGKDAWRGRLRYIRRAVHGPNACALSRIHSALAEEPRNWSFLLALEELFNGHHKSEQGSRITPAALMFRMSP